MADFDKDWCDNLNKIEESKKDRFSFFEFIWDLIKTAAIVVILAFGIKYYLVQPFIVDGNSMQPNFENSEYLLVEKIGYKIGQPKRGDVIVFHPPGQSSINYIKRVVGLPNEKIEISSNQVKIINDTHPEGIILNESYIPGTFKTLTDDKDGKFATDGNEYFVLGDNREHSSDSREWGNLPKENIIGRAWANVYPLKDLGIIQRIGFSN